MICLAARKMREKARTLSGDALGVELDEPESDIVADLLEVIGRRFRAVGGHGRPGVQAGHTGHILITTRCHFTSLVHLRLPSRVFLRGERGAVAAWGR